MHEEFDGFLYPRLQILFAEKWTNFAEPFRCQQLKARRGGMRSVLRKALVDFLSLVTWELVPFVQGVSNGARPKLGYALFFVACLPDRNLFWMALHVI